MNREQFEAMQAKTAPFGGSIFIMDYWQDLCKAGFAVAVERMSSVSHWEVMFPAMDIPHEAATCFFKDFDTHRAMLARAKANSGLLATRNLREKKVIATAKQLTAAFGGLLSINDTAYDGSPPRIVPEGLLNYAKGELSLYLLECVEDGDWKSLETLAKLIKRRDAPEDTRGGEMSYEGQTWTAFCLLHWNSRTLPTKAEIRKSMPLTEDNKGEFSKWLNGLGLGGIPDS